MDWLITPRRDPRGGIDRATRDRMLQLNAPFLRALDRATDAPTDANVVDLRSAADELMRALARILIETRGQDD